MSGKPTPELCCPVCAAELTIEQLFAHAETRDAFARLARLSVPLGARVLAYVALFAPKHNRQTIARKAKLIEELLPDLQRLAVNRKGRDWDAPLPAWSAAIEQMLGLRDQGKLQLPLTSHGYLYEIIAAQADKAERTTEAQREAERRGRSRTGGSTSIGAVIDDMDAALAKATAAANALAARPAPPPPSPGTSPLVRQIKAELARKRAQGEAHDA